MHTQGELVEHFHHAHARDSEHAAVVTQAQTALLLQALGFVLDELSLTELYEELDADGDGLISEEEFIACIGMIKCDLLETMHLERSFKSFRPGGADASDGDDDEVHEVYASDLVAALGVTPAEAEEMIFIADLKDNQSIDFTEFKQVVVNWSG